MIDLWNNIRNNAVADEPWLIGGDFNIIVESGEIEGGSPPDLNSMNDFVNCIADTCLKDMDYIGLPFTWQWRNVKHRLDRVLANSAWDDIFKENSFTHRIRRWSDHRPLIGTSLLSSEKPKQAFHFQNIWLQHPNCIPSIEQHWKLPTRNSGLKIFWEKLKRLK